MNLEKQQLIHDLLEGDSRREATLLAGAKILRRRRQWRGAWRACASITLATAVLLLVGQKHQHQAPAQMSMPKTKPAAPPQAQSLTDDELLALFPHTPVALATLPNGRKRLIFPRPGDEARFIMRL